MGGKRLFPILCTVYVSSSIIYAIINTCSDVIAEQHKETTITTTDATTSAKKRSSASDPPPKKVHVNLLLCSIGGVGLTVTELGVLWSMDTFKSKFSESAESREVFMQTPPG